MTASLMILSLFAGSTPLLDGAAPQTASFEVRHPLRTVDSVSHDLEGAAERLPDGTLRAHLRVRVDSFRSGNASCDEYMQEALDAAHHPFVEVRVAVRPAEGLFYLPAVADLPAKVSVTVRGVSRTLSTSLQISSRSAQGTRVSGGFVVDLDEFGIALPSYLLLPIDRRVSVRFELNATRDISYGEVPAVATATTTVRVASSTREAGKGTTAEVVAQQN